MANQVDLSLILPKADPDLILNNVNLTGLNNVDFKTISAERSLPKVQPFAEANYIRPEIPLYGSPNIPENQRSYSEERNKTPLVSQANSSVAPNAGNASREVIEFFDQVNWDNISIDSKIIHYARFATRFAANRPYDVIFASNWLTYLAGNELQLITGKSLAIQLNTLCQDHRDLNNQGWRYELEKMVIERSNHIFTYNPIIADSIEAAYPLSANKVICLDGSEVFNEIKPENTPANKLRQNKEDHKAVDFTSMNQNLDWESKADKIVQVLTKLYSSTR